MIVCSAKSCMSSTKNSVRTREAEKYPTSTPSADIKHNVDVNGQSTKDLDERKNRCIRGFREHQSGMHIISIDGLHSPVRTVENISNIIATLYPLNARNHGPGARSHKAMDLEGRVISASQLLRIHQMPNLRRYYIDCCSALLQLVITVCIIAETVASNALDVKLDEDVTIKRELDLWFSAYIEEAEQHETAGCASSGIDLSAEWSPTVADGSDQKPSTRPTASNAVQLLRDYCDVAFQRGRHKEILHQFCVFSDAFSANSPSQPAVDSAQELRLGYVEAIVRALTLLQDDLSLQLSATPGLQHHRLDQQRSRSTLQRIYQRTGQLSPELYHLQQQHDHHHQHHHHHHRSHVDMAHLGDGIDLAEYHSTTVLMDPVQDALEILKLCCCPTIIHQQQEQGLCHPSSVPRGVYPVCLAVTVYTLRTQCSHYVQHRQGNTHTNGHAHAHELPRVRAQHILPSIVALHAALMERNAARSRRTTTPKTESMPRSALSEPRTTEGSSAHSAMDQQQTTPSDMREEHGARQGATNALDALSSTRDLLPPRTRVLVKCLVVASACDQLSSREQQLQQQQERQQRIPGVSLLQLHLRRLCGDLTWTSDPESLPLVKKALHRAMRIVEALSSPGLLGCLVDLSTARPKNTNINNNEINILNTKNNTNNNNSKNKIDSKSIKNGKRSTGNENKDLGLAFHDLSASEVDDGERKIAGDRRAGGSFLVERGYDGDQSSGKHGLQRGAVALDNRGIITQTSKAVGTANGWLLNDDNGDQRNCVQDIVARLSRVTTSWSGSATARPLIDERTRPTCSMCDSIEGQLVPDDLIARIRAHGLITFADSHAQSRARAQVSESISREECSTKRSSDGKVAAVAKELETVSIECAHSQVILPLPRSEVTAAVNIDGKAIVGAVGFESHPNSQPAGYVNTPQLLSLDWHRRLEEEAEIYFAFMDRRVAATIHHVSEQRGMKLLRQDEACHEERYQQQQQDRGRESELLSSNKQHLHRKQQPCGDLVAGAVSVSLPASLSFHAPIIDQLLPLALSPGPDTAHLDGAGRAFYIEEKEEEEDQQISCEKGSAFSTTASLALQDNSALQTELPPDLPAPNIELPDIGWIESGHLMMARDCSTPKKIKPSAEPQLISSEKILLGAGSFSKVMQGWYNGKMVAIKRFHPHKESRFEMAFREREMLSIALGCEDVPNVYLPASPLTSSSMFNDSCIDSDVCIVMEQAVASLKDALHGGTVMLDSSYTAKLLLMVHISSSMEFLSSRGIVHGDIKPSNILLFPFSKNHSSNQPKSNDQDEQNKRGSGCGWNQDIFSSIPGIYHAKLSDFGLSKKLEEVERWSSPSSTSPCTPIPPLPPPSRTSSCTFSPSFFSSAGSAGYRSSISSSINNNINNDNTNRLSLRFDLHQRISQNYSNTHHHHHHHLRQQSRTHQHRRYPTASHWGGTPAYSAPELYSSRPRCSERSDVYAFGTTLNELLTGCVPFANAEGDIYSMIRDRIRPKPRFNHKNPQELCDNYSLAVAYLVELPLRRLIDKCWEHLPANRPPFSEITATLLEILEASWTITKHGAENRTVSTALARACQIDGQRLAVLKADEMQLLLLATGISRRIIDALRDNRVSGRQLASCETVEQLASDRICRVRGDTEHDLDNDGEDKDRGAEMVLQLYRKLVEWRPASTASSA